MKVRNIFTLFLVFMLFVFVSMGTVMAGTDAEDKELTIIKGSNDTKGVEDLEKLKDKEATKDSRDDTKVTSGTGQIPEIGNINTPSSTEDITDGLGIFADMGKFILEYAVHIAIFIMVLAVVILSLRGSWARSNNKVDDAVDTQKNQRGLIIDGILAMGALLFIFYILAPFVKSFIPS